MSEFITETTNDDFAVAFNAAMTRSTKTDWTPLNKYFQVLHVVHHGRMQRPDRGRDVIPGVCQRKGDALACNAPD